MKRHLLSVLALATAMFASATVTSVAPGENVLVPAITAATSGDTLLLSTGNYTEWSSTTINKAITIMAAADATPEVGLYAWKITDNFEANGLHIRNVSTDNYLLRTGGNVAGTIALKNCTLDNQAPTPFLYLSSNTVGTITIDNCIFTGTTKNQGGVVYGASATVTNFTMTNSTAYNVAGELAVWVNTCTNATVNHCTLYNCGTRAIYVSGSALTSCAVSNCIVVAPTLPDPNKYCIATYAGTVDNCLYYNLQAPRADDATVTGCIEADPLFTDAANANFTLATGSPALAAATDGTAIGDPRWAPAAPAVADHYLIGAGDLFGGWNLSNAILMPAGVKEIALPQGNYEFKVLPTNANWDGQLNASKVSRSCSSANVRGTDNIHVSVAAAGTTLRVQVVGDSLCITGTFEPNDIVSVYAVVGDPNLVPNGWNEKGTACDMTAAGNGTYTYTIENKELTAGDYQWKVVGDRSWSVQFPTSGDYILNIPAAGTYNIVFTLNPAADPAGTAVATPVTATALDNAEADNVVKIIRNGQLIIIRDGKTYNALGQQL